MKATAVFADGHIEAIDFKDSDEIIAHFLRVAHKRNTRPIDVKINWPKIIEHRTIAEVKHTGRGDNMRCGDCGRKGQFTGDDSSPCGPSPFGVVRYYSCSCGNSWDEVECAT